MKPLNPKIFLGPKLSQIRFKSRPPQSLNASLNVSSPIAGTHEPRIMSQAYSNMHISSIGEKHQAEPRMIYNSNFRTNSVVPDKKQKGIFSQRHSEEPNEEIDFYHQFVKPKSKRLENTHRIVQKALKKRRIQHRIGFSGFDKENHRQTQLIKEIQT